MTLVKDCISYTQVEKAGVKTKFYSTLLNKVFTRSEIIKDVKYDWNRISDEDNFNDLLLRGYFPCDLEELKRIRFYREDQIHPFDCEFASGRSCHCWCGEKYHGLKGKGAEVRK